MLRSNKTTINKVISLPVNILTCLDRVDYDRYAIEVRLLGLDYGNRRIGLALSDSSGTLARPWKVLDRQHSSNNEAIDQVLKSVRELQSEEDGLGCVVVGLPTHLDGTPNEQTVHVQAFVDALRKRTELPVTFQDERLSSYEAERLLAIRETDWRKRKSRLDAAAATVILQDYLDTTKV